MSLKTCPFLLFLSIKPPPGWSVPDKVYLGHRQLRTYQQMPDAQVSAGWEWWGWGWGVRGTAVRPERNLVVSRMRGDTRFTSQGIKICLSRTTVSDKFERFVLDIVQGFKCDL